MSEYNPQYEIETLNESVTVKDKLIITKPTWFAHNTQGSIISPDNSDLFHSTNTLKELLNDQ